MGRFLDRFRASRARRVERRQQRREKFFGRFHRRVSSPQEQREVDVVQKDKKKKLDELKEKVGIKDFSIEQIGRDKFRVPKKGPLKICYTERQKRGSGYAWVHHPWETFEVEGVGGKASVCTVERDEDSFIVSVDESSFGRLDFFMDGKQEKVLIGTSRKEWDENAAKEKPVKENMTQAEKIAKIESTLEGLKKDFTPEKYKALVDAIKKIKEDVEQGNQLEIEIGKIQSQLDELEKN